MNINLEQTILRNVLVNEDFMRKVLPFIKPEYFEGVYKSLFVELGKYVSKYNRLPTLESFKIGIDDGDFNEEQYRHAIEILPEIFKIEKIDQQWLYDTAEKWCQDRALYNAVMESISIIDGKHQSLSKNALPDILSTALGVTFDTNVGHDFIGDAEKRYDFYHKLEEKVEFDLDMFNKITEGGLSNKTLNIALAGTGVGKSLFMCHMASSCISRGKNVLYITLEMAEERIAERIDANLMNMPIMELKDLSKAMFDDKISKINDKIEGRLIIKEYPTASAHAGHFKALLNELKLKRSFFPDIIFIDYLNICTSSRFRPGTQASTYVIIKSIAEELRGLAVEQNVPIVSATQTKRGGFDNSDVSLTDTAESCGLPATADVMFAMISTEELEQMGQFMIKQLKNRYADPTRNKRFMIGVDRAKMKLFDLDPSAQQSLTDANIDVPIFEKAQQENKYDKLKF